VVVEAKGCTIHLRSGIRGKNKTHNLLFQHFVFTIVRLIDLLIPDIPEKLEALIHLEDSFAREMMKEVIEVDIERV